MGNAEELEKLMKTKVTKLLISNQCDKKPMCPELPTLNKYQKNKPKTK